MVESSTKKDNVESLTLQFSTPQFWVENLENSKFKMTPKYVG
jgi:hypothetical protein